MLPVGTGALTVPVGTAWGDWYPGTRASLGGAALVRGFRGTLLPLLGSESPCRVDDGASRKMVPSGGAGRPSRSLVARIKSSKLAPVHKSQQVTWK